MIAGRDGLGFAVWDARNGLRIDLLAAAMVVDRPHRRGPRPRARAAHADPERALGLRAMSGRRAASPRLSGVSHAFGGVEVSEGPRPRRAPRRVRGPRRTFGLRQDDAPEPVLRLASARARAPSSGPAGCAWSSSRTGSSPGSPWTRTCASACATCPSEAERTRRAAALLALIGLSRLRRPLPAPALGRHAPARGAGAGPGGRHRPPADGRALLVARLPDAPAACAASWRGCCASSRARSCS